MAQRVIGVLHRRLVKQRRHSGGQSWLAASLVGSQVETIAGYGCNWQEEASLSTSPWNPKSRTTGVARPRGGGVKPSKTRRAPPSNQLLREHHCTHRCCSIHVGVVSTHFRRSSARRATFCFVAMFSGSSRRILDGVSPDSIWPNSLPASGMNGDPISVSDPCLVS